MVNGGTMTKLSVEEVEQRLLLAGVVDINVDLNGDGDLSIVGDADDNSVTMLQFGDTIIVLGTNGTKLESSEGTVDTFLFGRIAVVNTADFDDDIKIDMGDGDDSLTMLGVTVPDDLGIDMGAGNDSVTMAAVTVLNADGSVDRAIELGTGDDSMTVLASSFAKDLKIEAGEGDDNVIVVASNFGKSLSIDGNDGNDRAIVIGSTFKDKIEFEYIETELEFGNVKA